MQLGTRVHTAGHLFQKKHPNNLKDALLTRVGLTFSDKPVRSIRNDCRPISLRRTKVNSLSVVLLS